MTKKCSKCKQTKDISEFYKDKNKDDGISWHCKACYTKYRENNREVLRERGRIYHRNNKDKLRLKDRAYYLQNREVGLVIAYKKIDKKKGRKCNLDAQWVKDNITSQPCTYCGSTERIGCDRIDNTKGHMKNNVIPCCYVCNTTRNINFTVPEMMRIGKLIRIIRMERALLV